MEKIHTIEDFLRFLYPSYVEEGKLAMTTFKNKVAKEFSFFSFNEMDKIYDFVKEGLLVEEDIYLNMALQNEKEAKIIRINSKREKRKMYLDVFQRFYKTEYDKHEASQKELQLLKKKIKLFRSLVNDYKVVEDPQEEDVEMEDEEYIEEIEKEEEIASVFKNFNQPLLKTQLELLIRKEKDVVKDILKNEEIEEKVKPIIEKDRSVIKKFVENSLKYTRGSKKTTNACFGFWLDIDINIEGHHKNTNNMFTSFEKAFDFLMEVPIKPNIIVNSGGGYHVYYVLKETQLFNNDEERNEYELLVKLFTETLKLKAESIGSGNSIDNTSDLARMLRLPFTKNFKRVNEGILKDVDVVFFNNKKYSLIEIENIIDKKALEKRKLEEKEKTKKRLERSKHNSENHDNSQANAELMKSRCSYIEYCSDNQEGISYNERLALLQTLIHCKDGEVYAHEWTKYKKDYDEDNIQDRVERLIDGDYSPVSCDRVKNGLRFDGCKDCPFNNKITSPIQTGYDNVRYNK